MTKFWIYFIRFVIVLVAMLSTIVEDFYVRFIILAGAFSLFEVHDYFARKDNDNTPPIARI